MQKIEKSFLIFASLLLMALPTDGFAAMLSGAQEYSLPKGQTVEDSLYIGAGNATLAGVVAGDLIVAGGSVLVSGEVSEDLMAAGGSVNVLGRVGQDARVAAGQVSLTGRVGKDAVIAGGSVQIVSGAVVEGDLVITGGRAVIDGEIFGNVKVFGGEVVINSAKIEGDAEVSAGSFSIGRDAFIGGKVEYRGQEEAQIDPAAVIRGEYVFSKINIDTKRARKGFEEAKLLISLASVLLFYWVFRRKSQAVVQKALGSFWKSAAVGAVGSIAAFVLVALLVVSIAGISLAILAGLILAVGFFVACIFASMTFGVWLKKVFLKRPAELNWIVAVNGAILLSLLGMVPVLGGLVYLAFFLASLGALYSIGYAFVRG